jgi:hypothetical protein
VGLLSTAANNPENLEDLLKLKHKNKFILNKEEDFYTDNCMKKI